MSDDYEDMRNQINDVFSESTLFEDQTRKVMFMHSEHQPTHEGIGAMVDEYLDEIMQKENRILGSVSGVSYKTAMIKKEDHAEFVTFCMIQITSCSADDDWFNSDTDYSSYERYEEED